jgi:hypothetical protein
MKELSASAEKRKSLSRKSMNELTNADHLYWRLVTLGLLLVAMIGPWAFDVINVPAEYSCSAPFIRLDGDFCGTPLSGMKIFAFMVSGLIYSFSYLYAGELDIFNLLRELLFSLSGIIFLLPFLGTLILIRGDYSQPKRLILIVVWGLAAGLGLLLGNSSRSSSIWALWGIWLYIGIAVTAMIFEGLALVRQRRFQHRK